MKRLKLALLKLMGEQKYLLFLAISFQRLFRTGRLGSEYQDIYFLKRFIRSGDCCVDIGAHLGYYSFQLSRLVGREGKVIAIEPVSKFHEVLQRIITSRHYSNIKLEKVALGGEGSQVEIGIPKINNQKKYGYARIRQLSEYLEYAETEVVTNSSGDDLLKDLNRIDFIKCDVEGAEVPVFRSMPEIISRHKPVLLCELADKNERIKMHEMLASSGYHIYHLRNKKLKRVEPYSDEKAISHNHYFIPESKLSVFNNLISG